MDKKGFTLIELIGTILIISLMVLIIYPTIDKVIKQGGETADNQLIENIILAAKNWASDNRDKLPNEKGTIRDVALSELQKEGYIDKNIQKPTTKEKESETNCVRIENITQGKRKTYSYHYPVDTCIVVTNEDDGNTLDLSISGAYADKTKYNGEWTNKDIILSANIKKSGGNITANKYYWFNGTTKVGQTTSNEFSIGKDEIAKGKKEGEYYYSFGVKEIGQSPSYKVKLDRKAPTIAVSKSNDDANKRDKLTITLTDAGSEVAGYALTKTTANPTTWTSKQGRTVTAEENVKAGIYYLHAKDKVGNQTYMKIKIKPRCSVTLAGTAGTEGWYRGEKVTVTLNSLNGDMPGTSGLATTKKSSNKQSSIDHTSETEGTIYYGYLALSENGETLEGTCQNEVKLDKTAPTSNVSTQKDCPNGDGFKKDTNIKVTCSDNKGAAKSGIQRGNFDGTISSAGENKLITTCIDKAGNETKVTANICEYSQNKTACGSYNESYTCNESYTYSCTQIDYSDYHRISCPVDQKGPCAKTQEYYHCDFAKEEGYSEKYDCYGSYQGTCTGIRTTCVREIINSCWHF